MSCAKFHSNLDKSRIKFSSNWNCDEKYFVKWALWRKPQCKASNSIVPLMEYLWAIMITDEAVMDLMPDTQKCGLRMRQECRERFPRHRLQRKPRVSYPGMHHGSCVTHVPWCMSGSLTRGGGENVPGIPGACAIRNFSYLVRDQCCEYNHWDGMLRWHEGSR